MAFRYSCFISYRHGQYELANRIINDLKSALQSELENFLPEGVFMDEERLKGGDFYNEEIATALCESICMIVVYTPRYFEVEHTYCAREFRAMELLEEQRLQQLSAADRRHGLIIPIAFRGAKYIPKWISAKRHCYEFEQFLLSDVALSRDPRYATQIKEIAEYVKDRREAFVNAKIDPCSSCETFRLPTEDDIRSFLEQVASPAQAFVLRRSA